MSEDMPRSEEFVLTEILRSAVADWVHMADVSGVLEHYARITDPAAGRRVALRVLSEIIERGLMNGGVIEGSQFVPYPKAIVVDLLERMWPEDHFAAIGDVPLWLDLTETGKAWLRTRGLTWD